MNSNDFEATNIFTESDLNYADSIHEQHTTINIYLLVSNDLKRELFIV